MPLLPYDRLRPLSLPGSGDDEYCQLQHLLNRDNYLELVGISMDDRWRLGFLRDVADAIDMLHQHGVTVGDLSPLNIDPIFGSVPRCYFVDCDAMTLNGRSVLPQAQTRGWEVPGPEEPATFESDAYKFALLAVRLFAGDQDTRDNSALYRFSKPLGKLAKHGLTTDPQSRPKPAQWVEALTVAAVSAQTVYRVAAAAAPSPVRVEASAPVQQVAATPVTTVAPSLGPGPATKTRSRLSARFPRTWARWQHLKPGRWPTVPRALSRGWRIAPPRTRPVGWPIAPPSTRPVGRPGAVRRPRPREWPLWRWSGWRRLRPGVMVLLVFSLFAAGWWLSGASVFDLPWAAHQPERPSTAPPAPTPTRTPTRTATSITASPVGVTDFDVKIRFCPYRSCTPSLGVGDPGDTVVRFCRVTGEVVYGNPFWDWVHDETVDVFGFVSEVYLGPYPPEASCIRAQQFTAVGVHIRDCPYRDCAANPDLGDPDHMVTSICRTEGEVVDGHPYWDWVYDETIMAIGYVSEANIGPDVPDARC